MAYTSEFISAQAMALLQLIAKVEQWVKDGDPRAQPYLDADAVRLMPEGHCIFQPERFDRVMKEQGKELNGTH